MSALGKGLGGGLSGLAAVLGVLWQIGVIGGGNTAAPLTRDDLLAALSVPAPADAGTPAPAATQTVVVTRAETVVLSQPAPPAAKVAPPTAATFDGRRFDVEYPIGWIVDTAEVDKGGYEDTTIQHPGDPRIFLRVDVTPGDSDYEASAETVEGFLRDQPGYTRLDFSPSTLGGRPAVRWEFVVRESGSAMRKVAVFFADGAGNGFAVLTAAPAAEFGRWATLFDELRASVEPAS